MNPQKVSFSQRRQQVWDMAKELEEMSAKLQKWAAFLLDEANRMAAAEKKFEERNDRRKSA